MRDLLLTPRKLVKRIIAVHHRELVQPDAYRKNTSSIWLNATRACIVDKVPELRSVMKNASAEAEVINLERAEKLKSGMALLTDPREYCQEIGKFPDSDKEAKERLAADYICLEHSVKGDSLLIFTKESMLRLLRRRGLDESFLELVYQKLSHSDALRSRSDSLHFAKSANGRFVTIYAKKFENYAIS